MKIATSALFFAIMLMFIPCVSIAQWTMVESGVTTNLNDIQFVDDMNGWAVGNSGTIIHTSDGGQTWESQENPNVWDIDRVFFVDAQSGYALANHWESKYFQESAILNTNNGGKTWEISPFGNFFELTGIFFLNPDTGWVSGEIFEQKEQEGQDHFEAVMFKTEDGGFSWEQKLSYILTDSLGNEYHIYSFEFSDVVFVNNNVGYTAENGGIDFGSSTIYKTIDGGDNWDIVGYTNGTSNRLIPVGEDTLWCTGGYPSVSFDGGITWNQFSFNSTRAVAQINGNSAYYNVDRSIYKTSYDKSFNFINELILEDAGSQYLCSYRIGNNFWFAGSGGIITQHSLDPVVSITDEAARMLPKEFKLHQNYPNPFNPETTIVFLLQSQSMVSLRIFNIEGKMIKNLTNKRYASGRHELIWNGSDNLGNSVASGIYFYNLTIDNRSNTRKMMLVR